MRELRESDEMNTVNERIAALLGFKKIVGHGSGIVQWKWARYDKPPYTPLSEIPDFVKLIDEYMELITRHRGFVPREFTPPVDSQASTL